MVVRQPKAERPFEGREALDEQHPLVVAYRTGRINRVQYQAGDQLRTICAVLERSGRDSTDFQPSGGSPSPESWFNTIVGARKQWLRIRERLGGAKSANWIICFKFCGEGWSLPEAILAAGIPCNEDARTGRLQEALNALAGVREPKAKVVVKQPKQWLQRNCPGCRNSLLKVGEVRASAFGHQGNRFALCVPCFKDELAQIAEHGPVELEAIYRQRLFLPPQAEEKPREHVHRHVPERQEQRDGGWKSRHRGFGTMQAA